MAHADPQSQTPPDHELTPMETFFDNLFNHHMVLPQTPEESLAGSPLGAPCPIKGEGGDPT